MFKAITRTIWILSVISLFNDMASEMLYPVMPVYLKKIGFSMLLIGVLEGIAEAVSGISKGYFGSLSDRSGKRMPFVQAGYLLSALSKPLIILFINPVWVFLMRTADRFGKGIRVSARDAVLSDESSPQTKGKIFSFHRGMDTMGAVLGPSLALIYLYFHPDDYRTLFIIALAPGIFTVMFTLLLKDKKHHAPLAKNKIHFFSFLQHWKTSPALYKKVVIGLLLFMLFNSSDIFLLMKVKETGMNDQQMIGVYIFYNLIYALAAFPLGILADKIGLKNMLGFGLLIFAFVYFGMSKADSIEFFAVLFFMYGIYAAATEGISKALISNISDKSHTATAIGTYTAFQSICTMLASSIAGLIWMEFNANTVFVLSAAVTLIVAVYFLLVIRIPEIQSDP